jgi:LPXTG-motif cell wall-anchored protein
MNLPLSQWVQRPNQIEVTIPASAKKTYTIDIFNGRTPLLPTQLFICAAPVVEVTPTASPTPEVTVTPTPEAVIIPGETTTEIGGELPDTGTNTYTYLLIGLALLAFGAGGFILRQRIKKS